MELNDNVHKKIKIFHINVLETTVNVIKRNVDKKTIKNQTYVVSQDDTPIYVYIKAKDYDKVLEQIKKHYEPNTRTVESKL